MRVLTCKPKDLDALDLERDGSLVVGEAKEMTVPVGEGCLEVAK